VTLALITTTIPAFAEGDSQANEPVPQRYRGRIASLSGPTAGGTAFLVFHVDRFATDTEVQALAQVLGNEGEEALLKAVADIEPGGWVKIGNGLRYHLRVIRSMETPEGRMLIGITDRPIQFGEIARSTRSRQYTFGWIQILFDADGKGEGNLIPTAKINFNDEGRLVVESFGIQPFRILKVTAEKIKK
jgi:hypothetical protein